MRKEREEEESEKWFKYYSSSHQILLVGDGDFSFSLSLALSLSSASNILATSLDQRDVVIKKYSKAEANLENLEMLGATILHGVDATKMKLHTELKMRKFDRIIFNFPHAGFRGKEDEMLQLRLHRNLVQGFFRNASRMLRTDGEIHVNHKTTKPFCCWKIEELASKCSLTLLECLKFEKQEYPGYNHKRGDGLRCNESFPLGECSTFKFGIVGTGHQRKQVRVGCSHEQPLLEMPKLQYRNPRILNVSEQSQAYDNTVRVMLKNENGNSEIFIRADQLPIYHTTMQEMPKTPDVNVRPFSRNDLPSPVIRQGILESQNRNPGVFSRTDQLPPVATHWISENQHRNPEVFGRGNHPFDISSSNVFKTGVPETPDTCYSDPRMLEMCKTQDVNIRTFSRDLSPPVTLQGILKSQHTNPGAFSRTDQLPPVTMQWISESQHRNPDVFSRGNRPLDISYSNVYETAVPEIPESCYDPRIIIRNENSLSAGYKQMDCTATVPGRGSFSYPLRMGIFSDYLSHNEEMFGRTDYDVGSVAQDFLNRAYDMYMNELPGRSVQGYIWHLQRLHRLTILRLAQLRGMMLDSSTYL